jgi:twitching motility two-component system response regulator PilG
MSTGKKTVLVVEDKASLTQMLQFLFLSKGLSVQIAFDGKEALEKVSDISPDLILLDIMMPRMDGFEVLERLKGNPETAKIPVIMLTARKSREDMDKARDLGAVEYITKPFKAVEVVDKVLRHIGQS